MNENNEFNMQDLNTSNESASSDTNASNEQQSYIPYYTPAEQQPKQNSGFAIASLVLGILSLLCCGSFIMSVLAIVFYFVDKNNNNKQPNSLARIGMILGIISLVLTVIFYIAYIGIIVTGVLEGVTL